MIKLRDYQVQALEAERRHRTETPEETRLAIVLPTGTGKAVTLAARAADFLSDDLYRVQSAGRGELPRRVLILVHTDELVRQLEATVSLVCSKWNVGIVKAESDQYDAQIIVASVQTLARPDRRARIADVGLVIIDEAHHALASSYQEILRHYGCMPDCDHSTRAWDDPGCWDCRNTGFTHEPTPALGFTATLERGDGTGLGSVWQDVAYTRDVSWGVRKGYLVEPIGYRLEIGTTELSTINGMGMKVTDDYLTESLAPEKIAEKWLELAKDRKTVAFMPLVRSARALCDAFRAAGIEASWIAGDEHLHESKRRFRVKAYRSGEIQVLCNAMVLTEGFDDPDTSCVIVGRPTKSRPLFIQMAGRGLRPVPGIPVEDQNCIVISLADATTDLCSIADLSDRLTDRKADGPLTVMEDEWDLGLELFNAERHWTGKVDATRFDPIVAARSKVWARTKGGHWFLPISKDREYVFLLDGADGNTDIYVLTRASTPIYPPRSKIERVQSVPDQELAFSLAEDEASERGGDVGALLADRTRAWRKGKPGDKMLDYARRLGLGAEVDRIMSGTAGGKAGKVSDLIRRVEASRSIDKAAEQIKERRSA